MNAHLIPQNQVFFSKNLLAEFSLAAVHVSIPNDCLWLANFNIKHHKLQLVEHCTGIAEVMVSILI